MAKNKRMTEEEEIGLRLADGLNVNFLYRIIELSCANNVIITTSILRRAKELLDLMTVDDLARDRLLQIHYFVASKLLEARLEKDLGLDDFDLLTSYPCHPGKFMVEAEDLMDELTEYQIEISDESIRYMSGEIDARIRFARFAKTIPKLQDTILRFQTNDFDSLQEFVDNDLQESLDYSVNELKIVQSVSFSEGMDFDTTSDSLPHAIEHVHNLRSAPGFHVKTGIKKLNDMLGGNGYDCGRVYTYLGVSGRWKSGMLLNSALWTHLYNTDLEAFDSAKKPCALYVTLENDGAETLERMMSYIAPEYCENGGLDISKYDPDTLIEHTQENFLLRDDAAIFVKYRANRTINSSHLEGMIDDLRLAGWEVRLLAVDYIDRLNSITNEKEERLRLASVVAQLSTLAKGRNIPVVTAGQLNREAMRIIEEQLKRGDGNIAKSLNSSHIGESWGIIKESDVIILGNPQIGKSSDEDGEAKYFTLKRLKMRGREVGIKYFAHPFVPGCDMRLQEDIELPGDRHLSEFSLLAGESEESREGVQAKKPRGERKTKALRIERTGTTPNKVTKPDRQVKETSVDVEDDSVSESNGKGVPFA